MSTYLEQYDSEIDEDQSAYCRRLEMKIHYLMGMLADAGLLKDKDGKVFKTLPDAVADDANAVQSALNPKNF